LPSPRPYHAGAVPERALQHCAVERHQRTERLILGRRGNAPAHREIGQELRHLGLRHLPRMALAVEQHETLDPVYVALLGAVAVVSHTQRIAHGIQKATGRRVCMSIWHGEFNSVGLVTNIYECAARRSRLWCVTRLCNVGLESRGCRHRPRRIPFSPRNQKVTIDGGGSLGDDSRSCSKGSLRCALQLYCWGASAKGSHDCPRRRWRGSQILYRRGDCLAIRTRYSHRIGRRRDEVLLPRTMELREHFGVVCRAICHVVLSRPRDAGLLWRSCSSARSFAAGLPIRPPLAGPPLPRASSCRQHTETH